MLLQEDFERMDWASYGHQEREEGFKEGLNESITGAVKILHGLGYDDRIIAEMIRDTYDLTDENAETYVEEALHSQTP